MKMKNIEVLQQKLELCSQKIRSFEQGDFEYLTPIADAQDHQSLQDMDQAIGLLAKALTKQEEILAHMFDIIAQISKGRTIDEVLNRIYDSFQSLIPYDRIGCALLTDDHLKVQSYWTKTRYQNRIEIKPGYTAVLKGSSLENILKNQQPRIINDLQEYLKQHPKSTSTRLILAEGVHSSLTCPLVIENHPIGFLFFSSCATNTYQGIHQRIFLTIAHFVSVLIEKSRLNQQIDTLNQQLLDSMSKIQEQAERDALTGLFNRGTILNTLQERLKQQRKKALQAEASCFSIIMLDVDHFKLINDQYGHLVGDVVLKHIAHIMQGLLRQHDLVGRYGGEEFLVILANAQQTEAMMVAERLRKKIQAEQIEIEPGLILQVTISLGIACSPRIGMDEETLLKQADDALYQAKNNGRNQIVVYVDQ